MDEAVEIFAAIVRSAPYGRYTARAQFDIGRAREREDAPELAIDAYQSVVEKFPNDPLAVDAQYQIGYIWFSASRSGIYDPAAAEKARTAFQDFLFRFPKSEKAPQARENLAALEHRQVKSSLNIAKYYDKAKNYRAAVLYYNEVLKQQPNSTESDYAKKRIAQLRAKVGDAALQSAAEIAAQRAKTNPPKKVAGAPGTSSVPGGAPGKAPAAPPMRANPNDIAPLPPPADANSLPPPATEGSTPADSSGAPAPSPTPEATASPAQ
jgi:outer membrane protein assembly factor BamD